MKIAGSLLGLVASLKAILVPALNIVEPLPDARAIRRIEATHLPFLGPIEKANYPCLPGRKFY
jgi:hypothetical protein